MWAMEKIMLRILDTTTTTQWSFRDIFQEQIQIQSTTVSTQTSV